MAQRICISQDVWYVETFVEDCKCETCDTVGSWVADEMVMIGLCDDCLKKAYPLILEIPDGVHVEAIQDKSLTEVEELDIDFDNMPKIEFESVTEKQFQAYEAVRQSGVTNMFAIGTVCRLSHLKPEVVMAVQRNYSKLAEKFPNVVG